MLYLLFGLTLVSHQQTLQGLVTMVPCIPDTNVSTHNLTSQNPQCILPGTVRVEGKRGKNWFDERKTNNDKQLY